jgi:hypothetical protein
MAAGDSAEAASRELAAHASGQLKRSEWFAAAAVGERLVRAALDRLTECDWQILADRQWPGTGGNIDFILVGPGGVVVVDAKNWRHPARATHGHLTVNGHNADKEIDKLLACAERVAESVVGDEVAPAAVISVMVFCEGTIDCDLRGVRLVSVGDSLAAISGLRTRLGRREIDTLARHVATAFPEHRGGRGMELDFSGYEGHRADQNGVIVNPTQIARMYADYRKSTRLGPIERWMTFLHPDQLDLVTKDWSGPARISGVAGTGKTVVALHRAAFSVKRTSGRILYTTFAKNLPVVERELMKQLQSISDGRVEFCNLDRWAKWFVKSRGLPVKPSDGQDWFAEAWRRAAGRATLSKIDANPDYWKTEIDRVIKGLGLTSLDAYLATPRRGRTVQLQPTLRPAVWELYLDYERIRRADGGHGFADVLLMALESLRDEPDRRYASVIVDEVQDLTMVGLKVLHALVGDAPNGLLLLGDGRQKIYPGGFTLREAGIEVRGRSKVLKINYRNGSAIFGRAQRFLASSPFDDIDDAPDDQTAAFPGDETGLVTEVTGQTREALDQAMVAELRRLSPGPDGLGSSAVLCATNRAVNHYLALFKAAGVAAGHLADYGAVETSTLKVGTFDGAKGLEFKHVFMPDYLRFINDAKRTDQANKDWLHAAQNRVYVGMTRPRDTLWLGVVGPPTSAH